MSKNSTRRWYGAYEYLRDHDLVAVSSTSAHLRTGGDDLVARIADELRELAGVLTGTHRHGAQHDDLILETSQALYWLALVAVANGIPEERLRADRALATAADRFPASSAAALLEAEAAAWATQGAPAPDLAARLHAAMALVAQACRSGGASPVAALRTDLDALRAKPYLADYFAAPERS